MKSDRGLEPTYVCRACRQPKLASLGTLTMSRARYNQRYFVCDHCRLSTPIRRLRRPTQETPPERKARTAMVGCGELVRAEYPLGPFIYDFAVPSLRLLIEIDSRRFHRLPRQAKRDRAKDRHARENRWKLVRLQAGPNVGLAALLAVNDRRQELGG